MSTPSPTNPSLDSIHRNLYLVAATWAILLVLFSPWPALAQDCGSLSDTREMIRCLENKIARARTGSLPVGTVVLWAGSLSDIPAGWKLCDGREGRPDLSDRFALGLDPKDPMMKKTGGSIVHDHGGSTQPHTLTPDQIPQHSHKLGRGSAKFVEPEGRGDSDALAFFGWGSSSSTTIHNTHEDGGRGQAHSHGISRARHIPPYCVLAYIIKVR